MTISRPPNNELEKSKHKSCIKHFPPSFQTSKRTKHSSLLLVISSLQISEKSYAHLVSHLEHRLIDRKGRVFRATWHPLVRSTSIKDFLFVRLSPENRVPTSSRLSVLDTDLIPSGSSTAGDRQIQQGRCFQTGKKLRKKGHGEGDRGSR